MAVHSDWFDVTDSDVDTQIENAAPSGTIDDRAVVDEGQDKIRVIWFYTP